MIKILNFRSEPKNAVLGYLDVEILPFSNIQIRNIAVLEKGGRRWLNMPSRKGLDEFGKESWIPIIDFPGDKVRKRFNEATLEALDLWIKTNTPQPSKQPTPSAALPDAPSYDDLPF